MTGALHEYLQGQADARAYVDTARRANPRPIAHDYVLAELRRPAHTPYARGWQETLRERLRVLDWGAPDLLAEWEAAEDRELLPR